MKFLKQTIGRKTLNGLVFTITEIPVPLIREIVAEILAGGDGSHAANVVPLTRPEPTTNPGRYDAFADMGGRLSFSAAVVDDRGDGLVISSIHARGESRTYAKGVVGGTSDATLTPEEQQALAAARTGKEHS